MLKSKAAVTELFFCHIPYKMPRPGGEKGKKRSPTLVWQILGIKPWHYPEKLHSAAT